MIIDQRESYRLPRIVYFLEYISWIFSTDILEGDLNYDVIEITMDQSVDFKP